MDSDSFPNKVHQRVIRGAFGMGRQAKFIPDLGVPLKLLGRCGREFTGHKEPRLRRDSPRCNQHGQRGEQGAACHARMVAK